MESLKLYKWRSEMVTEDLKKQTRAIDLAVLAGHRRQSPRTGFVHLYCTQPETWNFDRAKTARIDDRKQVHISNIDPFTIVDSSEFSRGSKSKFQAECSIYPNEESTDTIPIYENFCYALALFRQKTAESVTLGKELIGKLLAFQNSDGNFPIYLHDFPRCFDFQMPYKIAPILIYLLRLFSPVLGELKPKIEEALNKALAKAPEKPIWKNRYRACKGLPLLPTDTTEFSPQDWTEWLITAQLAGETHFSVPYDEEIQLLKVPPRFEAQERGEPRPNPIEWLLAEGRYSPRLLRDHPHQLGCAPLFPISYTPIIPIETHFSQYWNGSSLHSLVGEGLIFDLPEGVEMGRHDLFEAALFSDISPETTLFVEGRKATAFKFGDVITIQTPQKTLSFRFELTSGSGDFYGHIFRSNRPSQTNKGYEAYDWQIGIRTLRRSPTAQIQVIF